MDRPLLPELPGYESPQLIAHGTTALVFRAIQTTLNRPVAIKVITMDTGEMPVNTERELATTVALSSQPHIVSIIDTGVTADDRPYIVMEYCEGGSYAQILRRGGPLPVDDVVEVGITIGEALHAAHQAGIVHRDVKPSNILRSRFGPALTDFGIARAPDELGSTLTREMMTPHHASPEALLHQAQSGSSDVYSLASTLWTLLVGHPPFVDPARPGMDMYAFRDRVLNDALPAIPRADVPDWLVRELQRAMSKLPSQRHGTAREFADALRRAMLGLAPLAPTGPASEPASPVTVAPAPASAPPIERIPSLERMPPLERMSPAVTAEPVAPAAAALPTSPAAAGTASAAPAHSTGASAPPQPAEAVLPARGRAQIPTPEPLSGSWTVPAAAASRTAHDPADVLDEGGWLGPVSREGPTVTADRPAGSREATETGPPTRRFDERDLVAGRPAGRGAIVAVLVAIAVLAVAGGALIMLNGGPSRAPRAAPSEPASTTFITAQATGGPTDVRIERDAGTSVTVRWSDPTGGTASFLVVGTGPAAERLDPVPLPQGTTETTITGLDPAKNYCFTVSALYTVNQVAPAPDVCTSR